MNITFSKIFITGDIHGTNFSRIKKAKKLGCEAIIICGDFGYVWSNVKTNAYNLRILNNIGIIILFIDGNHENFDILKEFPFVDVYGGKAQKLGDNVFHLVRGEIYTINNRRIFTLGGAASTDKEYRIEGESWWREEIPNYEERDRAWGNLEKYNYKVDYILTHTAPSSILKIMDAEYRIDEFTDFLEEINNKVVFEHWYFGHLHQISRIDEKHSCVYNNYIDFQSGATIL